MGSQFRVDGSAGGLQTQPGDLGKFLACMTAQDFGLEAVLVEMEAIVLEAPVLFVGSWIRYEDFRSFSVEVDDLVVDFETQLRWEAEERGLGRRAGSEFLERSHCRVLGSGETRDEPLVRLFCSFLRHGMCLDSAE